MSEMLTTAVIEIVKGAIIATVAAVITWLTVRGKTNAETGNLRLEGIDKKLDLIDRLVNKAEMLQTQLDTAKTLVKQASDALSSQKILLDSKDEQIKNLIIEGDKKDRQIQVFIAETQSLRADVINCRETDEKRRAERDKIKAVIIVLIKALRANKVALPEIDLAALEITLPPDADCN